MSGAQVFLALRPPQSLEITQCPEKMSPLVFLVNLYASLKTQTKCLLLWKVLPDGLSKRPSKPNRKGPSSKKSSLSPEAALEAPPIKLLTTQYEGVFMGGARCHYQ